MTFTYFINHITRKTPIAFWSLIGLNTANFSAFSKSYFIRSFSKTSLPNVDPSIILDPYFITSLADAESSFSFSTIKSKENTIGRYIRPSFSIELNDRDVHLLYLLKSFFGVGNIRINKINSSAIYSVQSVKDLINAIIPHFDKYPLLTHKQADFLLFKSVIELMEKKEHLSTSPTSLPQYPIYQVY